MSILGEIRDDTFRRIAQAYKALKGSAAVFFIIGCMLTLYGIFPNIEGVVAHNNPAKPTQTHCGHSSTNISTSAFGEAGPQNRYVDLPPLPWEREGHCQYRRPGGHREDTHPPE